MLGGVEEARSALQRHFGYSEFRPGQGEAIRSALSGRDTLIVMPTGGGKSLCYQVPALVLPGLTIVVSPLIALMLDQVSALERRGVPAALINSTLSASEIERQLARAAAGDFKLLYVAPERFASGRFRRALGRMNISMVAVDEAHCVCEWGHDFRPAYLRLKKYWDEIGRPRILALTATATPEVRRDIVKELGLRNARILVKGFDRPNLFFEVRRVEKLADKTRLLRSLLQGRDQSAVVYASTRKMVEAACELLRGAGVAAAAYHAGLSKGQRTIVQAEWTSGRVPVVVATNAFGMGIDKDDVRQVVHFQMPGSLEAYYQEGGRAGRDGRPARCTLLHSYRDRFTHEHFIRSSYPPRKAVRSTYRALCVAARSAGGPVEPRHFSRRASGVTNESEFYSALRILRDAGVIEDVAARADCTIRWIVPADRVRWIVQGRDGERVSAEALPLLRGLARRSSQGERRLIRVSRRELVRWAGGDFAPTLDALQAAGVLGWRDEGLNCGYVPVDSSVAPEALQVDWDRVAVRRRFELEKLKRMEKYAFQRGCRRRYLLEYFGEEAPRRCRGQCDRCSV